MFSRLLPRVDPLVLKLTRGHKTLSSVLAGFPEVAVTTIGAKSGKPRQRVLVYIRDPDNPHVFALVASNFGAPHNPAWYYNLKANPRATCTLGGETAEYIAHEARGDEYAKFWRRAAETYGGYSLYQERCGPRHIPILVMVRQD